MPYFERRLDYDLCECGNRKKTESFRCQGCSRYRTEDERVRARRETWRASKARAAGRPARELQLLPGVKWLSDDESEPCDLWAARVWASWTVRDRRLVAMALADLDVQAAA